MYIDIYVEHFFARFQPSYFKYQSTSNSNKITKLATAKNICLALCSVSSLGGNLRFCHKFGLRHRVI